MRRKYASEKDQRSAANKRHLARTKLRFESQPRAAEKKCGRCKVVKLAGEFYLSNSNKDGLHGWCKDCSDKRTTEMWRLKNLGVTPEDFERMLVEHGGVCAICGSPHPGTGRKTMCVDHDHSTGAVRGLLCSRCNLLLGRVEDSVEILENAANYLRRHRDA